MAYVSSITTEVAASPHSPPNEEQKAAAFLNRNGAPQAQIDENGCCPTDPDIQLQRFNEDNGVWTMVQPHCPLCETRYLLSLLPMASVSNSAADIADYRAAAALQQQNNMRK